MYRTAIFVLLTALGLMGCGDVFNSNRKVASEQFSIERELANQTRLVLQAINGTVAIGTGDTDLFIPVNTSAAFSAVVGNGSIEITGLDLQNLLRTNKTVMGVLGDGDGAVTLQTANGRITASGF